MMKSSKRTTLQDAQGKSIRTDGQRMLNLTFCGRDGTVTKVQEAFTVGVCKARGFQCSSRNLHQSGVSLTTDSMRHADQGELSLASNTNWKNC